MSTKIIILDNIRSAHNVGSIFRTADGAGVGKIYLVGTTPTPLDRFGREVPEIKKTSLGASSMVPWEYKENGQEAELVALIKEEDFQLAAVEQRDNSVSLYEFKEPEKVCYVFGNEIDGVSGAFLEAADQIVDIPMKGQKESLNVSVTAGIVLFKNP